MVSDSKDLRLARFSSSAHLQTQWPEDLGAEVAFAGRSNVGKSSALNAITGQSRLARTSKTPGRTQQIVFFNIDPNRRLVDLPGYGYAKVPASLRKSWKGLIENYLMKRKPLRGVVLILDVRRGWEELDLDLKGWLDSENIRYISVATKVDKLSRSERKIQLEKIGGILHQEEQLLIPYSSKTGEGRKELLKWIQVSVEGK